MKSTFKNAKNFAAMFALFLINLATGPCNFADGGAGTGGGSPQQKADEANGTTLYGFEDQLRSIIMKEIEASEQVSLADEAVDHVNEMSDDNPLYKLASSITAEFTNWFEQNGISPDTFKDLPGTVEGSLVEGEGEQAQAAGEAQG